MQHTFMQIQEIVRWIVKHFESIRSRAVPWPPCANLLTNNLFRWQESDGLIKTRVKSLSTWNCTCIGPLIVYWLLTLNLKQMQTHEKNDRPMPANRFDFKLHRRIRSHDVAVLMCIPLQMKADRWIDRQTRAIFIDFNLYFPVTNTLIIVRLLTEIPAAGGMLSKVNSEFHSLWKKILAARSCLTICLSSDSCCMRPWFDISALNEIQLFSQRCLLSNLWIWIISVCVCPPESMCPTSL